MRRARTALLLAFPVVSLGVMPPLALGAPGTGILLSADANAGQFVPRLLLAI